MCNLCKSVDHKANVRPSSWAREPTGNSPPHEGVVSVADPVLNDADNHNTDDMFKDDNEEEDENEEQKLHVTFDTDDVFVAAPGIPLSTQLNTNSSNDDIFKEKVDKNPQETAADSPNLFLLDTRTTDSKTPNPGRKPAKLMEINIPLRNPTKPTLVAGKTAKKREC
ncbi:hypothetical protein P5673_032450 [Acropora cervicornis]|uniref:Uncharacterized protein n=1 Tax=Acropora cervicornis TaxID=6130 RepID=A0AAD9URR7_ACRCE|nr:hypothetical protein P5673_032450 [Acropora cervicornis]